jgi:hypothetical protein
MQDTNPVLEEVVGRLRHLPISRIIAFGSYVTSIDIGR